MKKHRHTILLIFLIVAAVTLAGCGHEHTFGDWTVEKEPSCIESGVEIRVCQCGETESRDLALVNHTDGPWVTDQESTCTALGSKHLQCAQCGAVLQTQAIESTGHVAGDWIVDTEPTTTQTGVKIQKCTICDTILEKQTIPVNPGVIVVLDAGHGGKDPGEVVGDIQEKDINLQIALKMKKLLEANGITVIMTREEDVFVSLEERAVNANGYDAALFVSVHCNSYDDSAAVSGFEVYYYQDKQAKSIADAICSDLEETGQLKMRGVKTKELYVIKNTTMPAILLEMGFLTNEAERQKLCSDEYQQMLAEVIAARITLFLTQPQ